MTLSPVLRLGFPSLLAAAVSCATTNSYHYVVMRGIVLDPCRHPIPQIQVIVPGTAIRGFTNDSGQFELTGDLASGTSIVRAQGLGFRPADRRVKVRSSGPVTVAPFTLKWSFEYEDGVPLNHPPRRRRCAA